MVNCQCNPSFHPPSSAGATNGWGRLGQVNWKTSGGMQFAHNHAFTTAWLATSKKMTVTKTRGSYTQTGELEITYSYDNEGKLTSMAYPTERLEDPAYPGQYRYLSTPTTGLTYNYSYDSLGRPIAMSSRGALHHSRTGNQSVTWVDNVSYGVANEMLAMRYRLDAANGQTTPNYYNESHQYNSMLRPTGLTVAPTGGAQTPLNLTYQLASGQNDGLIEKSRFATRQAPL
jgi:hypothetical protein